jgi:hypothetical protein
MRPLVTRKRNDEQMDGRRTSPKGGREGGKQSWREGSKQLFASTFLLMSGIAPLMPSTPPLFVSHACCSLLLPTAILSEQLTAPEQCCCSRSQCSTAGLNNEDAQLTRILFVRMLQPAPPLNPKGQGTCGPVQGLWLTGRKKRQKARPSDHAARTGRRTKLTNTLSCC